MSVRNKFSLLFCPPASSLSLGPCVCVCVCIFIKLHMTTQFGLVCMLCVCVLHIHRSGLNDTHKYCLTSCQSGMWFAGLKKYVRVLPILQRLPRLLKLQFPIICLIILEYTTAGREKGSKRTQGKNYFDNSGAKLHTVIRRYDMKIRGGRIIRSGV